MEPLARLGRALAGVAPPDAQGWAHAVEAARAARLEPLLLHAQRDALPEPHRRALERQTRRVAVANLYAQRELDALLSALGPRTVVLKGPVIEALAYPPGVPRSTNDLDLLVPAATLPGAAEALRALGYAPVDLYPHRPASRRVLHEHLWTREVVPGAVRQPVELHTALCQAFRHRLDDHALHARSLPFRGGRRLDDADLLIHLAVHLGKEQFRSPAKHLADVDLWVRRGVPWDALVTRAAASATRTGLHEALRLSQALFQTPVPPGVLRELRPPAWARPALAFWHAPRGTRAVRARLPIRAAQALTAPASFDHLEDAVLAAARYTRLRIADALGRPAE